MQDAGCEVGLDVAQRGVLVARPHHKQTRGTSQVGQLQHLHLMARGALELAWGSAEGESVPSRELGKRTAPGPGGAVSRDTLLTGCVPPAGGRLRPKSPFLMARPRISKTASRGLGLGAAVLGRAPGPYGPTGDAFQSWPSVAAWGTRLLVLDLSFNKSSKPTDHIKLRNLVPGTDGAAGVRAAAGETRGTGA